MCRTMRPPLEASDLQVTAATIRSLLAYAPKSHQTDYRRAVDRASRWLEQAEPTSTEDHVFQILGIDLEWRESRDDPEGRLATAGAATIRWWVGTDSPVGVQRLCNRPGARGVAGIGDHSPCRP